MYSRVLDEDGHDGPMLQQGLLSMLFLRILWWFSKIGGGQPGLAAQALPRDIISELKFRNTDKIENMFIFVIDFRNGPLKR